MKNSREIKFIFFGTSKFSVLILEKLKSVGFLPTLIITTEDKPKGRKLVISPSEVKVWAKVTHIPFIEPKTLKNEGPLAFYKVF